MERTPKAYMSNAVRALSDKKMKDTFAITIAVIALVIGGVVGYFVAPTAPGPAETVTVTGAERTVTVTQTAVVTTTPPLPKKLTVWWSTPVFAAEAELIPQYVEDFMKATGAEVEWVSFPHVELDEKIMPAVETGTNPDIIFQAHSHVLTILHEQGKLMPLTDVIDEIGRDDIFPFLLEMARSPKDGVEYMLPYYPQGNWFHYRKDILASAGYTNPPETWDELLEIARAVNKPEEGIYALGFPLGATTINDAPMTFEQILWSYGGQLVAVDGETVMIDSEAALKTLEFYDQIINVDKTQTESGLTWGAYDNNVAFQDLGNIVFTGNPGGTIVSWMRDNNPDMYPYAGTAPWPKGPTGKHYLLVAAMAFGIFKNAKNPELAKDFVKFFCEKDRYLELIKTTVPYNYPMLMSALDDPLFKDPPMWEMFSQLTDPNVEKRLWGYASGPTGAVAEVYSAEVFAHMIERIAIDKWTPQEALDEGVAAIKAIYDKWYG